MTRRRPTGARGQFIVGGVIFLCILAIIVQTMVWYTQREAAWTVKAARAETAFYVAESGYQRAIWQLKSSAANFAQIQNGNPLPGYNNDFVYKDVKGGSYQISITSGPGLSDITIIATGKDNTNNEFRAVKAIVTRQGQSSSNSPYTSGEFAIRADGLAAAFLLSNLGVEWGPALSGNTITSGMKASPYYWSSAGIDLDTNGVSPPNQDAGGCHWKSWDSNLPGTPAVDLNYYKNQAQASGTYYGTNQTWGSKTDTTGKTYYVDGNLTLGPLIGSMHIDGNLIVMGNLNLPLIGNGGSGSETITMPTNAWTQYCANWNYYRTTFDPSAPLSFPGVNGSYASDPTIAIAVSPVAVNGFVYLAGNLSGGLLLDNTAFIGVTLVKGTVSSGLVSSLRFYYHPSVFNSIQTTTYNVTQTSWAEAVPQAF